MPRIGSAGPEPLSRWHGVTTIVLIGLPAGTLTRNCADCGAPAEEDELVLTLLGRPDRRRVRPRLWDERGGRQKVGGGNPG